MLKRPITLFTLVTAMVVISVPALATPTTMQLSSWTPEISSGAIAGGTQTVTVTNVTAETVFDTSISLDPAPCDCAIESYEATQGTLAKLSWTIERLQPGATATLTIQYQDSAAVAAGNPGGDSTFAGGFGAAVSVILLLVGAFLSRPDRFGITAA